MKKEKRRFVIREKNLKKKTCRYISHTQRSRNSIIDLRFFLFFFFFSPPFFSYFIKLEQENVSLCRGVNLFISRPFVALFVTLRAPVPLFNLSLLFFTRCQRFAKIERAISRDEKPNATCFCYIFTISESRDKKISRR